MGSTIVLIFEAPPNFNFSLTFGQKLKMGEGIGCVAKSSHIDKNDMPNKISMRQSAQA